MITKINRALLFVTTWRFLLLNLKLQSRLIKYSSKDVPFLNTQ